MQAADAMAAAAAAAARENAKSDADVTRERISFNPHPKTLTMAGDYEYFAAQGQTPFAFALAELVDNSLRATKGNRDRARAIAVTLCLDASGRRGMVCVRDNGCGMTTRELNDWAVMNLSVEDRAALQAARGEGGGAGAAAAEGADAAVAADADPAAAAAAAAADADPDGGAVANASSNKQPQGRYLSGDISFFGVGSKNAAFYLGRTVRVATRAAGAPRVSELCIRGDELERRYRAGEAVYEEDMVHRPPGASYAEGSAPDERAFEAVMRPWLEGETAAAAQQQQQQQQQQPRPASGGGAGGSESPRAAANPSSSDGAEAAAASAAASSGPTFTRVTVTDLKEDVLAQLLGGGGGGGGGGGRGNNSASPPDPDSEDLGADITRDLAHLYHYYLHGAGGNKFT
jgi:hypothetical protein